MPASPDCNSGLDESDVIDTTGHKQPDPTFQFATYHCRNCDSVAQFRESGDLEHKFPSKDAYERYMDSDAKLTIRKGHTVVLPPDVFDRVFDEPRDYETGVIERAGVVFKRSQTDE